MARFWKRWNVIFIVSILLMSMIIISGYSVQAAADGTVSESEEEQVTDETNSEDEETSESGELEDTSSDEDNESENGQDDTQDSIEDSEDGETDSPLIKYDSYFEDTTMTKKVTRAVGTKYQLSVKNIKLDDDQYTVKWKSSNTKKATVSSKGVVKAVSKGKATITAVITCDNGEEYTYTCSYTVTNPKFKQTSYYVRPGGKVKVKVVGASDSDYKLTTSNKKVVSIVSGSNEQVNGKKTGKVTVSATVDGKKIKCTVHVANPSLKQSDLFIVKGKSIQLKVKNWSNTYNVSYKSSNKKVATVSNSGLITAKKDGSCKITVTAGGKSMSCYVAVGNKTVISTIKQAYKGLGTPYSQAKRMRNGYFDCSSFVWRSYSKYGVKFGNSTYAPTASAQAQYLANHKQVVAYKYVSSSKLLPGDVVYVKNSTRNGRYRNIGHVALYIGNGRIIHSTTPRVCISTYSHYRGRIALIGRPTK